ncbi:MAG: peptide-binding protein [Planctomycetaceae bacterium]|nr:peptide-binding protein [Planctomycetaceae bacterium]
MVHLLRRYFPFLLILVAALSAVWAVSLGTLPPAEFVFNNGTEVKTIDPAKATGVPEGRVINALYEGLLRSVPDGEPDELGRTPTKPKPVAMADAYNVSDDGTVYTFHIRESAKWSNGDPVTAVDFAWSWMRFLHPETASEYNYQLFYAKNASKFASVDLQEGDPVEIEMKDRPVAGQMFPRGTVQRGKLISLIQPHTDQDHAGEAGQGHGGGGTSGVAIFVVEFQEGDNSTTAAFTTQRIENEEIKSLVKSYQGEYDLTDLKSVEHVLFDFEHVGIRAISRNEFEVELNSPTPYFPELVAFYPLHPVHRASLEEHGDREFTKPGKIVGNGPFLLRERRIRDRLRLVKNDTYWNAENVHLNSVDVLAIQSETTSLNMYLNGQLDWDTKPPNTLIPLLKERDDFVSTPFLACYFYRVNTSKPPLDNPLVRKALNMAIDKQTIVDSIVKGGQVPARSFVPPGMNGYQSAYCGEYDVEQAKLLLAEAGYPNGKGLPTIEILYNTADSHRDIAEVIQQDWKKNLGVDVSLRNLEWGTFLDTLRIGDYMVSRSGWIGDYADPNTFLDMFVTDGPNNQTKWSNAFYDEGIEKAKYESDPVDRMAIFKEMEQTLMDEQPIIPIYFYVSLNMVNTRVKGFTANLQDVHPLHLLSIPSAGAEE